MKEIIKKSILLGLGALSFTDKQLEKAIKALEKSRHLKAGEGERLIKEISAQVRKRRVELTDFVRKEIEKGLRKTRLEVSRLEKKLSQRK